MTNLLIIRADSSETIGGGHIMRCLALANAWKNAGGEVVFACAQIDEELLQRINKFGHITESISSERGTLDDATQTSTLYKKLNAKAVVLDGYCFTLPYQKLLHEEDLFVVVYDDLGDADQFCCNMLVNQNVHAKDAYYEPRVNGAVLLMGSQYAAIRSEYLKLRNKTRDYGNAKKVVISLGLSDTTSLIEKILKCLSKIKQEMEIDILVGLGNIERIRIAAESTGHQVHCCATTEDFASLLAKTDFAILAAGGTAHEAASLGTPIIIIGIAENQIPAYREFVAREIALDGGMIDTFDEEDFLREVEVMVNRKDVRAQIGMNGLNIVDGQGAERVASRILKISMAQAL